MPKVRFGTVGGTKDINNNRAQITLEGGDFTIEYDYSNTKTAMITMTAKYNKEIYKKSIHHGELRWRAYIFAYMGIKELRWNVLPRL